MKRFSRRDGFTLIELLVVIAIIALLIGILLPALGKARKAARLTISMSNLRQINAAAQVYRETYKGYMPITLSYVRGTSPSQPGAGGLEGWCTWSYGGKNCSNLNVSGAPSFAGQLFDCEAADRPLNSYIFDADIAAPPRPARLATNAAERTNFQLPVFKDPGDVVGHQRNWPAPSQGISCYDDVGTSYQWSSHWWYQPAIQSVPAWNGNRSPRMEFGCLRMKFADAFLPSRFVWIFDEYADIISNQANSSYQLRNGFDDINKSVMGFMDGHSAYVTVIPGGTPQSYSNDKYSFIFEDLRPPD